MAKIKKSTSDSDLSYPTHVPRPLCIHCLKVHQFPELSAQKMEESPQPIASTTTQVVTRAPRTEEHPVVQGDKEETMRALKKAITSCKTFLDHLEEQQTCAIQLALMLMEVGEGIPANGKETQRTLQADPAEDPPPGHNPDKKDCSVAEVVARVEAAAAAVDVAVAAAASGAAEILFDNQDDIQETDITFYTVGQRIFRLSLEYMIQASSPGTQTLRVSQEDNLNSFCNLKETLAIFENLVQSIIEVRVYLKHFSRTQMAGKDETRMSPQPEQPDEHMSDHSQNERGHMAAAQMPSDQEASPDADSQIKELSILLLNFSQCLEDNSEDLLEILELGNPEQSQSSEKAHL
ncbi:uncharacterized protein [Notamacropus eugenii]